MVLTNRKMLKLDMVIEIFSKKIDIGLHPNEARYCFGMSKMTVMRENESASKEYFRMNFVEFIEMIARIAEVKFRGSDRVLEPLHVKITYILDELIPKILGREFKRREP